MSSDESLPFPDKADREEVVRAIFDMAGKVVKEATDEECEKVDKITQEILSLLNNLKLRVGVFCVANIICSFCQDAKLSAKKQGFFCPGSGTLRALIGCVSELLMAGEDENGEIS